MAATAHHPALISDVSLHPSLPELNPDSYNYLMTELDNVAGPGDYTRLLDVEGDVSSDATGSSSATADSAYSSPVRYQCYQHFDSNATNIYH